MSYSVAAFTANFQCQFAGRGFEWSCIKNFLKNPVVYFAFEHFVFSATELQLDNAKAAVLTAFDVRSDQFTFFASCNIRVLFLYRISAVYVVIFFAYFASCDPRHHPRVPFNFLENSYPSLYVVSNIHFDIVSFHHQLPRQAAIGWWLVTMCSMYGFWFK